MPSTPTSNHTTPSNSLLILNVEEFPRKIRVHKRELFVSTQDFGMMIMMMMLLFYVFMLLLYMSSSLCRVNSHSEVFTQILYSLF